MKKLDGVNLVVALFVSLGVVYGYTYIIGKSWKASQK
jgi:hypothetical protein